MLLSLWELRRWGGGVARGAVEDGGESMLKINISTVVFNLYIYLGSIHVQFTHALIHSSSPWRACNAVPATLPTLRHAVAMTLVLHAVYRYLKYRCKLLLTGRDESACRLKPLVLAKRLLCIASEYRQRRPLNGMRGCTMPDCPTAPTSMGGTSLTDDTRLNAVRVRVGVLVLGDAQVVCQSPAQPTGTFGGLCWA